MVLAPGVRRWDVRKGLPFAAGSFDAVYHSHLLEHLTVQEGAALLRECFRVLAPGGIVRIAVPDLEGIASSYLAALAAARAGAPEGAEQHDWMVLELLDQAARHHTGGEVPAFFQAASPAARRFALGRWGSEVEVLAGSVPPGRGTLARRLAAALRASPWAGICGALLGSRWRVGAFRMGGEVHRHMYDSYSLARALQSSGFADPQSLSATASAIPGWSGYLLDADADGRPHKPDSLYMEAHRPRGGSR